MRSHTDILSAATRVRASAADLRQSVRITQSVDNGLVQDGFTLESELVLLSRDGCVAILHAARCSETDQQRCYLWSIEGWKIEGLLEPHAGVLGASVGEVTSLVHKSSAEAQNTVLELLKMDPNKFVQATRRYDAQEGQESAHLVDMKRVTSIRAFINEKGLENFCEVASLEAVGQRTAEFLADFSHFVSGCLIRFPDIARSALKSRVRVSSERLDLVKRISFLMQSLSDGGLVPPVVAKRVRKRIGNIDQLIVSRTKRATGVSTRKAKVRKTVRRVQKESQKAQALPAKKRSAEQQEMLPEATSLETRDVESARARVAAARKNRQKRIASATNGVKAASPIRRKTVQISVDQLALF
jgi:Arc/MetJ family transcription regulator